MTSHGPLQLRADTVEATEAIGHRLGRLAQAGDVIALVGDLGAGKTAFVRGMAAGLGAAADDVSSPTFTLIQTYDLPGLSIAHLDLYRLKQPSELAELGLDDALGEGAALIEWPEMAEGHLPDDRLEVQLSADPRRAALTGHGRWAALVQRIAGAAR